MSRYRQRSAERRGMPVGDGMVVIERAARVVAAALGYGRSVLAPGGEPGHVFLLPEVSDLDGQDAGLSISSQGQRVQTSRGYLPTTQGRRDCALADFPPEQRAQVEAFDQRASMRENGSHYRVGQLRNWNNAHAGRVLATARPSRTVVQALALIQHDGPLADWLMVYAAGLIDRWPNVERHMVACRHPEWAAAEAAARMLGAGRPWREIAREQLMREADCRQMVQAAERRLWDWLGRAATALLAALT